MRLRSNRNPGGVAVHTVRPTSQRQRSWKSTFSVLVARERARVGMAAATQDWARRINRARDSDQENQDAGH